MTIDLGQVFSTAQAAVESALASSGTTVRVQRPSDEPAVVDPVTLDRTDPDPDVLAASEPALIAPLTDSVTLAGTATPVQVEDKVVILPASITDLQEQDEIVVLTCRDPLLLGRVLVVIGILESSAGVARLLHARPQATS